MSWLLLRLVISMQGLNMKFEHTDYTLSEVPVAVLRCITVRGRITVNYSVYCAAHNTFRVRTGQREI